MPELRYRPTNKYLPPREKRDQPHAGGCRTLEPVAAEGGFLGWGDKLLSG